jgi:hypothetical protein
MISATFKINNGSNQHINNIHIQPHKKKSLISINHEIIPPDSSSFFDMEVTITYNNLIIKRNYVCVKQYGDKYFDPNNEDFYDNFLSIEISIDDIVSKRNNILIFACMIAVCALLSCLL